MKAAWLSCTWLVLGFCAVSTANAQQRPQYLPGTSAANSGVMPDPGFTYVNLFYYNASDRLKGPGGRSVNVDGSLAVMVDNNLFAYVYKPKILGGSLASQAVIPVADGSLAASVLAVGAPLKAGGAGLANTYFVPLQIGWHLPRLDVQTGYGFFAPTGRYTAGASDNVGTGYWTHDLHAGATLYVTKNKATSLNAFNMYSFNTTQKGTNVKPGQNHSLDYSILQILPLAKDNKYLLQTGFAGYGQWQTSDSTGRAAPVAASRYGVNGIGFTMNFLVPDRKISVGTSCFWEVGAANTREGKTMMISAAFTL